MPRQKQAHDQTQRRLIWMWISTHVLTIIAAIPSILILHVLLQINRDSDPTNWAMLLSKLAIVGGVVGSLVGGIQSCVLRWMRLGIPFWMAITVVAMAVGVSMPMMIALAVGQDFDSVGTFDRYVAGGWFLGYWLTGLFQGALVGENRQQSLRLGLINATAGLFSVVAIIFSLILLAAILDHTAISLLTLLGWSLFIGLCLLLGGTCSAYVVLAILNYKRMNS